MATTKEFHDYIVENLRRAGDVTTRKMMGEYCVYFQAAESVADFPEEKKLIGNICDNCLFLKPTESVLRLMPDAERAYPYEGSKTWMVVAEDVENVKLMTEVLNEMYKELPKTRKKAKK